MSLSAYPAGAISDRVGRKRLIVFGWLVYALIYLGFALAGSAAWVVGLFVAYGLYHGTTQGVANALVADLVPPARRGMAYGLYNTVVGAAALPASVVAGLLWDAFGPAAPFFLGAGLALVAVVGLAAVFRESVPLPG
jgi:MFS family permease